MGGLLISLNTRVARENGAEIKDSRGRHEEEEEHGCPRNDPLSFHRLQ